jgi:uncharacterized protein (TIGR03000 family)
MYSVILMAAMSTGTAAAPNFLLGHHHGCYGCWGACNGCWGCCGGCYGGCWGGCYGSCYGGGYGGYSGGCYGSGYGFGYGYGGSFCLGGGCYGGCWGLGWGGYSYPAYAPTYSAPVYGSAAPVYGPPTEKLTIPPTAKPMGMATTQGAAQLVVEVPADAKLYIDNQLMSVSGDRRTFLTPQLQPGQRYYYELRAEAVRGGETVMSEPTRVIVEAGNVYETTLRNLTVKKTKPQGPVDLAAYQQGR